jgi:thymidylate synthase (FAD)
MPWNEVSRRYVSDDPEFYFPEFYRSSAKNVKQGSSQEECEWYDKDDARRFTREAFNEYTKRIQSGVCPEQARECLPLNTMTEWYWSGTLGAFLDMLVLRTDPHSQAETRSVAEKILVEVDKIFPVSVKAYGLINHKGLYLTP